MRLPVLQVDSQLADLRQPRRRPRHLTDLAVRADREVVVGRIAFLLIAEGVEEDRDAQRNPLGSAVAEPLPSAQPPDEPVPAIAAARCSGARTRSRRRPFPSRPDPVSWNSEFRFEAVDHRLLFPEPGSSRPVGLAGVRRSTPPALAGSREQMQSLLVLRNRERRSGPGSSRQRSAGRYQPGASPLEYGPNLTHANNFLPTFP